MSPENFIAHALAPALQLLPKKMDVPEARAMVVAICLQESRLKYRIQLGGGPAHGYAQFELGGGVRGVLMHPVSQPHIRAVLTCLDYDPMSDPAACWEAIVHNDILAAAFARLLLYTLPDALPKRGDYKASWDQYLKAWRPGKPHWGTWDAFYDQAWAIVT